MKKRPRIKKETALELQRALDVWRKSGFEKNAILELQKFLNNAILER